MRHSWLAVVPLVFAQCNGFNEVPTRCRTNKDCPQAGGRETLSSSKTVCAFDVTDGCDGRGHCAPLAQSNNCEAVACGCDGKPAFLVSERTPFVAQCADGFDRPIASMNACPK